MRWPETLLAIAALAVVAASVEYRQQRAALASRAEAMTSGNAERGRALFVAAGCGACHTATGMASARGLVGPPLAGFARRAVIAGRLANTPPNLMRWIIDPQAVAPGTVMPRLGITPAGSRDLAAFLYTQT